MRRSAADDLTVVGTNLAERAWASLVLAVCLAACGHGADSTVDLPEGWQGAARVTSFQQSACSGSPYEGPSEGLELGVLPNAIQMGYRHAHFRCNQTVEGFVRLSSGAVEVLVQPSDMNPDQVARCDCLYEISISIPVSSGTYDVGLFRRWDHKSGADVPLSIGSRPITVP